MIRMQISLFYFIFSFSNKELFLRWTRVCECASITQTVFPFLSIYLFLFYYIFPQYLTKISKIVDNKWKNEENNGNDFNDNFFGKWFAFRNSICSFLTQQYVQFPPRKLTQWEKIFYLTCSCNDFVSKTESDQFLPWILHWIQLFWNHSFFFVSKKFHVAKMGTDKARKY